MLTNTRSDRVRGVRALSRRAVRERQGLFLVEGPQGVREAVVHRASCVQDLYVTPSAAGRYAAVLDAAHAAYLRVQEVSDEVLTAMGDEQAVVAHQGLLAVCRIDRATLSSVLAARPRLLCVLSSVRDPGNAGTVLRGADAAGADAVVVTTGSVDLYSPKVVRSTAGSLFHLPVVTGVPVEEVVEAVHAAGLLVHAADGFGERLLGDVDLRAPHAWLFGNEAWGLPKEVRDLCDDVVRVPIHGLAESLNLAMAATVCLYASASVQRV
ncbi:MAG: RNA methyltransferase [Actinomycetota bacterium]|nr:RNA methyltransferase [Actinomycetota bacterium]